MHLDRVDLIVRLLLGPSAHARLRVWLPLHARLWLIAVVVRAYLPCVVPSRWPQEEHVAMEFSRKELMGFFRDIEKIQMQMDQMGV